MASRESSRTHYGKQNKVPIPSGPFKLGEWVGYVPDPTGHPDRVVVMEVIQTFNNHGIANLLDTTPQRLDITGNGSRESRDSQSEDVDMSDSSANKKRPPVAESKKRGTSSGPESSQPKQKPPPANQPAKSAPVSALGKKPRQEDRDEEPPKKKRQVSPAPQPPPSQQSKKKTGPAPRKENWFKNRFCERRAEEDEVELTVETRKQYGKEFTKDVRTELYQDEELKKLWEDVLNSYKSSAEPPAKDRKEPPNTTKPKSTPPAAGSKPPNTKQPAKPAGKSSGSSADGQSKSLECPSYKMSNKVKATVMEEWCGDIANAIMDTYLENCSEKLKDFDKECQVEKLHESLISIVAKQPYEMVPIKHFKDTEKYNELVASLTDLQQQEDEEYDPESDGDNKYEGYDDDDDEESQADGPTDQASNNEDEDENPQGESQDEQDF